MYTLHSTSMSFNDMPLTNLLMTAFSSIIITMKINRLWEHETNKMGLTLPMTTNMWPFESTILQGISNSCVVHWNYWQQWKVQPLIAQNSCVLASHPPKEGCCKQGTFQSQHFLNSPFLRNNMYWPETISNKVVWKREYNKFQLMKRFCKEDRDGRVTCCGNQQVTLPKQSISRVHRVNNEERILERISRWSGAPGCTWRGMLRTRQAGKASLLGAYSPGGAMGIKRMQLASLNS